MTIDYKDYMIQTCEFISLKMKNTRSEKKMIECYICCWFLCFQMFLFVWFGFPIKKYIIQSKSFYCLVCLLKNKHL